MITRTLKLRYGPRPIRDAAAWYISGSEPASWLEEVATWDVAHSAIRLLVVPRSPVDRGAVGVLALVLDGSRPSHPSKRCVPYGKIADQVYVPVEARLAPEVSTTELAELLSGRCLHVWHPVTGLVAFEPGDGLRLCELLTIGPPENRAWDRAVPGVAVSGHLISLAPDHVLTVEMILGDGRDDISQQSDELSELPPSPMEPQPGLVNATSRQGKRMLANMIRYFTRQIPATSDTSTWIDGLDRWSREQLEKLSAELNASRNREITRLLHMLETDPTNGLRFAIPLGGDAHRGVGQPGGRLLERDPDFSLGRLGGGQAADFWDLSWEYQRQLTQRYRELANREIQLGRHRRTAYIFAELLADFPAAAGALTDGGHWREAAVLYQQRLQRPLDAANCLEQGGLWTEAIALYEELGEHERAGDLLVRIEQTERAREQFHKAVGKSRSEGDFLSAARLLEEKLRQIDEAIADLSSAWPDAPQARQCLRELFQLYGRLGRHGETRKWLREFRDGPLTAHHRVELVNIVADTATAYPDRGVQEAAADCTRVLVSRQLSTAPLSSSRRLLTAVSRLVPHDRLLGRDCNRYGDQMPVPALPKTKSGAPQPRPKLIRTIYLPGGANVTWKTALAVGRSIFAAGVAYDRLLLSRCSWNKTAGPTTSWPIEPRHSDSPIILAADPHRDDFVLVHPIGGEPLADERQFPATDAFPVLSKAGSLRGMSAGVLAAARTAHGVTWLLEWRSDDLTLIVVGPQGQQMSTEVVPLPDLSPAEFNLFGTASVRLHVQRHTVYVGIEKHLIVFDRGKPVQTIQFASRITSLVGSAPKTRNRVAVTFETGGTLFWDGIESGHALEFAGDMLSPVVGFSRGGHFIAAGDGACQVYTTHDQGLQLTAEFTDVGWKPLHVMQGLRADQFGIVSEVGEIRVYQLPT